MGLTINKIIVGGRITKDPDLRFTPNNTALCKFSLVTEHGKKVNGEWEQIPTFHNIIIWGGLGKYVGENAQKGDMVTVTGRLEKRTYEKNGSKRIAVEIIADDIVGVKKRDGFSDTNQSHPDDDFPQDEYPDDDFNTEAEDVSDDVPF